jgi:hypothetical protein
MQTKFATPFYLLSALLAFLCVAGHPAMAESGDLPTEQAAAEPGTMNLRQGQLQVGDFGPDGVISYPTHGPGPGSVNHTALGAPVFIWPVFPETIAMLRLWDAWHKRVADVIYERFDASAKRLFKHSPPLDCQISYMVAKDGRIGNVRVLRPSSNVIFNSMLVRMIRSMAGDPVLKFPPKSKRLFVEKTAAFTWNHPDGCDFPPFPPPNIGPPSMSK